VKDKDAIIESMIGTGALTAEEAEMIANGAELALILEVNDVSETVSAEDKQAIESVVESVSEEMTVAQYLDIDLFKQISMSGVADEKSQITDTGSKLQITLSLSDTIINTDRSIVRSYFIACVHDGVAKLIPAVFNELDGTLSFENGEFSTYAIVYVDTEVTLPNDTEATEPPAATEEPTATEKPAATEEPTATEKPAATEKPTETTKPVSTANPTSGSKNTSGKADTVRTGDESNVLFWLVMLVSCTAVLTTVTIVRSTKRTQRRR